MKQIKKLLLISFLVSISLIFSACSSQEKANDEITSSQLEETTTPSIITGDEAKAELDIVANSLNTVSDAQYLDFEIFMSAFQEESEESMDVYMKVQTDFSNPDNPLMAVTMDAPVMGSFDMYFKDGYSYIEVMGIKVKEKTDIGSLFSTQDTLNSFSSFDDANDITLTYDSETGNKIFEFNYDSSSSINFDELASALGSSEGSIDSGDIVYTTLIVSEDNTIIRMHMLSATLETPEEATSKIDLVFNSFNQPFEISFPDLSEYTEY